MASGPIRRSPIATAMRRGYFAKREEIKNFSLKLSRHRHASASNRYPHHAVAKGEMRPPFNGASASPADALELRIQQFVALIRGRLDVIVVATAVASCKFAAPGRTVTKRSGSTTAARKCGARRRDQQSCAHNDCKIPFHLLASLGHQLPLRFHVEHKAERRNLVLITDHPSGIVRSRKARCNGP
jgi:hypothetical protein